MHISITRHHPPTHQVEVPGVSNLKDTKKDQNIKLEMWANAQRDGRPAEYRWRPLFKAAKFR